MLKNPKTLTMFLGRWFSSMDWRMLFLVLPTLALFAFFSVSSIPTSHLSTFNPLRFFILGSTLQSGASDNVSSTDDNPSLHRTVNLNKTDEYWRKRKDELDRSRMAVCLVGGARRFELTGPSIFDMILKEYPNSDLFLHSPADRNAFKFSLLKTAPRIAAVKIFEPKTMPETETQLRVLTPSNSPNGIQGLLQYFHLVEGCLTLIKSYQQKNNFTYDWIVRTRVDGYWNAPLHPSNFIPGHYLVPPGSTYGGLNDRLGIGNLKTSTIALSRLSLIPKLDSAGFRQLNSETAFRAQLSTQNIPYVNSERLPFCIVTDRKYGFPPKDFGVPVAAMSSPGPLSGAKCRPCIPVCEGSCVMKVMVTLYKGWSWTNWENGTLKLCDAHGDWEKGWEKIFDETAGERLAHERKRVRALKLKQCVGDFKEMKRRTVIWEAPPAEDLCRLGLGSE